MTGIVSTASSTSSELRDDSIAGDLSTRLPAHADTLARSIRHRVAATPDREAFRDPGWHGTGNSTTWGRAGQGTGTLAVGLMAPGPCRHDGTRDGA